MGNQLATLLKDESGSTASEYGILAAGIAVAIATSVSTLGCSITGLFGGVAQELNSSM